MNDSSIVNLLVQNFLLCSYVLTNPEGTELILVPRVEDDSLVEVAEPPTEAGAALAERVFRQLSPSSAAVSSEQVAAGNKERLLEVLSARRVAVTDEGERVVIEGGAATVRAPFASAADCRSSNTVVLERIRRIMEEM